MFQRRVVGGFATKALKCLGGAFLLFTAEGKGFGESGLRSLGHTDARPNGLRNGSCDRPRARVIFRFAQ